MKLLAPAVLLFVAVALHQTGVTNGLPCECEPAEWAKNPEDPCGDSPAPNPDDFKLQEPERPQEEFDSDSTGAVVADDLPGFDQDDTNIPGDVMFEDQEFVDADSDGVLDVPEGDGGSRFGYNEIISKFETHPAKKRELNSELTHTEATVILNRAMGTADQWYQTVNALQTPMVVDLHHTSERKVAEVRRKQAKRDGLDDYVDEKPDYHNFYEMEDDVNQLEEGNSLLPTEPVAFPEEHFEKIREHVSPLLIELDNLNLPVFHKQLTRMTQHAETAAGMRREFEARRQRALQEKADNITRRSVEDEEEISRRDMYLFHEIMTKGETAAARRQATREVTHQYESADELEFSCGPYHYLYQGPFMAPWFLWTWNNEESNRWADGVNGCADYHTQLDMEAYTLLAQLLEAFKLVKWILELTCQAIPDTCGASKVFETAMYIFQVFQRGAVYHLDFSHTTVQDGFLSSIHDIHVAITCKRIPEAQMEGIKYLGCNGMDDNCDETIDDRGEDHYGPEIHTHHASPMELGWFSDRGMGEVAVEESTYCSDDCLASPALTFNQPSEGQCKNNYYTAECTDETNTVSKDIYFYLDEESPSIDLCLGKSDFVTPGEVKNNNYEDIQLSYRVSDNCGADALREMVLIVEMNEDITPSLEEDTLVRFKSAPHHTEFVKVLPPRRGLPLIVRVLTERLAVKQDTRTYRFTILATDSAGNSHSVSENVHVGTSDTATVPMYELLRLPLPSTTSTDVAGTSCGTPRKYEDIKEMAFEQTQLLVGQDKEQQTQFLKTGVL